MKLNKLLMPLTLTLSSVCSFNAAAVVEDVEQSEQFGIIDSISDKQGYKYRALWKEPQDTKMAMNNPDLYAWRLFIAMNWPGNRDNCRADQDKEFGEQGYSTWQLWREVEQTFLPNAQEPKSWREACRTATDAELFDRPTDPRYTTLADEDTRLNRAAYNHVRKNKLYSRDEQERLVAEGVKSLVFPLKAKEAKANWVRIDEADKPRYHWVETESEGVTEIWGLAGLHIMTRDMPKWHWSTFEHVDNETRWPSVYPEAFRGWDEIPSSDSAACPADNLACNEVPEGLGIEGTRWENYRLRGSQIDWVDNRGKPTILPNSKIEGDFDQGSMSCMTCHALAVKGESNDGHFPIGLNPGVNEEGLPMGYVGVPSPELFLDENGEEVTYMELDFMWSLRHAQREE
ncbi:hypothetical protein [Shewanella woodyi]|uniref:hypothetical protein n=1 Tax=Shewanella woodyi TaxID=60961 RepID=UPI0007F88E63|nr:hypothetical protein [Shewanella woodyi]